ncbi:hypothetical protein AYI69_g9445 [Smittium culicis]|uniref:Uncharacterized protein n=1 Tax=Smittium culicis TaxID=133412 RepID=A0A1R1XCL2_9FUNG|nr:hypothetical protein AYI69_g9445 [Smittium culicis]
MIVQSKDESNNEWDDDENEIDFIDVEDDDYDSDLESQISNFREKNRINLEPGLLKCESKKKNTRADKLFDHMLEDLYDKNIEYMTNPEEISRYSKVQFMHRLQHNYVNLFS